VTLVYNARTFDARIPDSRLAVFDEVGHLTMVEASERAAAAIDDFLAGVLGEASGGD